MYGALRALFKIHYNTPVVLFLHAFSSHCLGHCCQRIEPVMNVKTVICDRQNLQITKYMLQNQFLFQLNYINLIFLKNQKNYFILFMWFYTEYIKPIKKKTKLCMHIDSFFNESYFKQAVFKKIQSFKNKFDSFCVNILQCI